MAHKESKEVAKPLPSATAAYSLEIGSAVVSALSVAPIISIIDKAIFSNASGKEKMGESLVNSAKYLIKTPGQFFKSPSFLWIWIVYGGTYIAGNTTETYCNRNKINYQVPKFLTSSAANIGLSVTKDRAFSRMFGTGTPKAVPYTSMALFGMRDSMTIAAGFNLPALLSDNFAQTFNLDRKTADVVAQLTVPVGMQIFNTPLHLLGMDLYNNPDHTGEERRSFIAREYTKTLFARWGRIFPAYGLCGVLNKSIRRSGHEYLNGGKADDHH